MDPLKEEFDSFKAAVGRMRWFMVTAVLISVLIVLHVYLEQFGFQQVQLQSVYAHRIVNYTPDVQRCYESMAKHLQRKHDRLTSIDPHECAEGVFPAAERDKLLGMKREDLLHEYARRAFVTRMTDNSIADAKLQIRRIPLLGVEVPANDFVTVMAIMSLVFVVGLWINLRGVRDSLCAIVSHQNPDIVRLARLNTSFLTAHDVGKGANLAKGVRWLALWLPFLSIVFATVLGYRDIFHNIMRSTPLLMNFGPGFLVVSHLAIAAVITLAHLWVAVESKSVIKGIDDLFDSAPVS